MRSRCLALPLLLAATAFPPAVLAVCVPTLSPVTDISVSFLTGDSDVTHRREFVHLSEGLADALGIDVGDVDTSDDGERPNPQIRVRIQSMPDVQDQTDIGENNAIFTVVAIDTGDSSLRIWVHDRGPDHHEDSGEFKLFARTNGTIVDTDDSEPDDILDGVLVSAFAYPVSSLAFTNTSNVTTPTTYFCEPSNSRSYVEEAVRENSDAIVVLAPHGGNIETATSEQAELFAELYEDYAEVPVNIWNLEGKWGSNQTDERWHITATSLDVASYPGLTALLPGDGTFDQAVSFHGFSVDSTLECSGEDIEFFQIILGGGAEKSLKCAIALAIDAEADGGIAIGIRDTKGDIEIADTCGREVTADGRQGTHEDNIVNRLASLGGIQVEQSKTIRDSGPMRDLVVDGVAKGMAEYDDGYDYCDDI